MITQKIVDQVFESVKPYINFRRAILFLSIAMLSSSSGISLLFVDYGEYTIKTGFNLIAKAVADSRFDVGFPAFIICFFASPHLNHRVAMLAFYINSRLRFIDEFFKRSEEGLSLSVAELESRKDVFVGMAQRYNYLLESLFSVLLSFLIFLFFEWGGSVVYIVICTLSLFFISILYIEATSKVVREYAKSVYLLRIKYEEGGA